MAVNPLIFKNAEKVRDSITESQKKEIANLYNDWANEIAKMAEYYKHKTTASAPLSERYYRELLGQLRQTSQEVSNEVYKGLKQSMYLVSDAVVKDNVEWLQKFGFSKDGLNAAFSYVPDSVVRSIVTGQVYDSGWSLSRRIWGDNEQTMKDLYRIVGGGIAKQTPIYEISKQLEKYVRPEAAKQWNLTDKDGKKIYPRQVDYNAQRLARTLVQHSYQQAFTAVNEKNPFVIDYVWNANGSRVCELCLSRDGQHFKKDELPLDHPNGMCTMEPNIDDNMADKLVEWFNSEDGTFPEIDEFAKQFGYDASQWQKQDDSVNYNDYQAAFLQPFGYSLNNMPKDFVEWMSTVDYNVVEKADQVANDMGLDLEAFFNKYVGNPNAPTRLSKEWIEQNCIVDKMFNDTGFNQLQREEMVKVLNNDNVSDSYRRAFAYALKYQRGWVQDDERSSYFSHSSGRISINMNSIRPSAPNIGPNNFQNGYKTVFHEVGHGIDYLKNSYHKPDVYTDSKKFQNAMMKDIDNLKKRLDSGKLSYSELTSIKNDGNSNGVQDILGACKFVENGKYYTIGDWTYTWGHSDDYWQRRDVKAEMASELFAHLSAAEVSTASAKYMDEYFPETKKQFEKIIEKVADEYKKAYENT